MRIKIVHVLCEGQTEQGFVESVLKSYLQNNGVTAVKSVLVTTNKKKNARGGMISYVQALNDLNILLKSKRNSGTESHIFTTMFDLYALPNDFPGYDESLKMVEPYAKVDALESSFAAAVNDCRFIPYIQLHEFEALLFCGIDYISRLYPGCEKACEKLQMDLKQSKGNPELINNGLQTAPSKRIIKAVEGNEKVHYNYNKPSTGKYVTSNIGIDMLRSRCEHFNQWIQKLIEL